LVFDSVGNLYLSEYPVNQIERIAPDGTVSLFAGALDNPRFIAIAPTPVPEPSSYLLASAGAILLPAYFRRRRKSLAIVAIWIAMMALNPSEASAQVVFTFTTIDVPGVNSTNGSGINDLGQVVGNYAGSNQIRHGFLRSTAGNYTTIDFPGATQTS